MSSKRIAISALLSSNAPVSPLPPSPATSDEPPLKRPRHQLPASSPMSPYYPHPPSASPGPSSASLSPHESRTHWDDPRYAPEPPRPAFDVVPPHRQTSNLHPAHDDHPLPPPRPSIASVLAALPVPPQLRRDAHHPHSPYPLPDPPPPSATARTLSPLAINTAYPRPTYSPQQHLSPAPSFSPHTISPTTYVPHTVSPTSYTRHYVSPATPLSPNGHHPSPQRPSPLIPQVSPTTPASQSPPRVHPIHPSLPYPPKPSPPQDSIASPVPQIVHLPLEPPLPPAPPQPPPDPSPHTTLPDPAPIQPDDERSFEDELLSLVDGDDLKPRSSPPSQPPLSDPSGTPVNRKPSVPSTKPTTAKSKSLLQSRPSTKSSSKSKSAHKPASATGTPVPPPSMPPPSPPPPAKQPPAPRPKGKVSSTKKKVAGAASTARDRSVSVKPAEPTPTPVPDVESTREDDRLYCVCETPYDEEKIMIACDRCDEWYHPACVGMPEVEVDLVDQYICGPCAKEKPNLRTTYKPRCHRGLRYIAGHDTLPTCWKPARGAFSKYCSDECGIAHLRAKTLQSGRDAARLWPAVKNAQRREGVTIANGSPPVVVVKAEEKEEEAEEPDAMDDEAAKAVVAKRRKAALVEARKALKDADERELTELLRRLDEIMDAREACKAALERVVLRRRLLDLAVDRATGRFCGWDVRLEWNDEEWNGWAMTEEGRRALEGGEGESEDDGDGGDEQWWCQGPEKCPRHNGWRNIRDQDVQLEVDSKNVCIKQLTDRERELRRRIEDINPRPPVMRQQQQQNGRAVATAGGGGGRGRPKKNHHQRKRSS